MLLGLYSQTMQSGKTTIAKLLERNYNFYVASFAMPIKAMIFTLLTTDLNYSNDDAVEMVFGKDKEKMIDALGVTTRHLMQTLGTEWGRQSVNQDIWIKILNLRLEKYLKTLNIVIDDMRFPNEAAWIKENGGKIFRVEREGFARKPGSHISEGSLDNYEFDGIIYNTMEEEIKKQLDLLILGV